jgi:curved DNA-binding protein CbpA
MDFKDYYKTLGLERTASDDEVRKAYRKLARKYHPDVSKEADAQARMRDINEANDVLRDKEKRAAYDALADRVARGGYAGAAGEGNFQAPPGWDEGFEFHRGPGQGPADHGGFSDFFSSVFGQAEHRGAEKRNTKARGEDHHAAIEISVEDAINGVQREITLRALENDAQGHPQFVNRTLAVKIPAGVHPGQFVRLTGHGMPGVWWRGGRRPVSGSAHRAAPAVPRRRARFVYDLARHADRSRAGRTSPGADTRRWRGGGERATQCTQRLEVAPEGARPARQTTRPPLLVVGHRLAPGRQRSRPCRVRTTGPGCTLQSKAPPRCSRSMTMRSNNILTEYTVVAISSENPIALSDLAHACGGR